MLARAATRPHTSSCAAYTAWLTTLCAPIACSARRLGGGYGRTGDCFKGCVDDPMRVASGLAGERGHVAVVALRRNALQAHVGVRARLKQVSAAFNVAVVDLVREWPRASRVLC